MVYQSADKRPDLPPPKPYAVNDHEYLSLRRRKAVKKIKYIRTNGDERLSILCSHIRKHIVMYFRIQEHRVSNPSTHMDKYAILFSARL